MATEIEPFPILRWRKVSPLGLESLHPKSMVLELSNTKMASFDRKKKPMTPKINRRTWLAYSVATVGVLNPARICSATEPREDLDIIDCHTHFFDPTRPGGVPWPAKDSPIYKPTLPMHLRELKQFRPVTGTVIVEASPRVEDNAWLLDVARDDPFVVGIVGNLPIGTPGFEALVERFAANPLFRGIRVSSKVADNLVTQNELADFELLADHDLALDVNGGPETPGIVAKLAPLVKNLRIVQNHIGNVPITAATPPADWQAGIRAAAQHSNVFCKISALVESASNHTDNPPDDLNFYRPYIDVVWNAFGDDRVIFGSNWPDSVRGGSYEKLQRIVMEYAAEKGTEATKKFCSLNAKKAYKWVERRGRG